MVVMAMRNCDGIDLLVLYEIKSRQSVVSLALRMNASVHQQTVAFNVDEPCGGPNVGIRIQVEDSHAEPAHHTVSAASVSTGLVNLHRAYFDCCINRATAEICFVIESP
jgi:hypothetical protein